jgi:hypothetical protein
VIGVDQVHRGRPDAAGPLRADHKAGGMKAGGMKGEAVIGIGPF